MIYDVIMISEDFILVLVVGIIILSCVELLLLFIMNKSKNVFKESFFYNVVSGIFLMASLLCFSKDYFTLCVLLLTCSGLFHFFSLITFLKRKS